MFKVLYESDYFDSRIDTIFIGSYTSSSFFGFDGICRVFGLKNFYGYHRRNNCFTKRDIKNLGNRCSEQYIGVFSINAKASVMFFNEF